MEKEEGRGGLRNFVLIFNQPLPDQPDFNLNNLTAKRMDMVCRFIQATLFLSKKTRMDSKAWVIFEKDNKTISISGKEVRHLRPDEANIASILRTVIYLTQGEMEEMKGGVIQKRLKCTKGFVKMDIGFADFMNIMKKETQNQLATWYYLEEKGTPVQLISQPDTRNPIFVILGDRDGLLPEQEQLLQSHLPTQSLHTLNLGPHSLLGSHCVIIFHHYLDQWSLLTEPMN